MRIICDIVELPPHLIRHACQWHCAEEGLSDRDVGNLHITWKDCPRLDSMKAELGSGKRGKKLATMRLGRSPRWDKMAITDRLEAAVWFTAWVLTLDRDEHRSDPIFCRRRLEAFRADRDNLLSEWYCPPPPRKKRYPSTR